MAERLDTTDAPAATWTAARFGLLLGVLAALILLAAGPGTRFGLWPFRTGFTLMRWGAYAGVAALVLSAFGLLLARGRRREIRRGAIGFVLGLIAFGIPYLQLRTARQVPPIHDITTDTEHPPAFVAILPRRADAANPAEYGGPDIARQQHAAYPDIVPLHLAVPPAEAWARALEAARREGWEIVATDSAAGRIEATARTRWFGFYDDVVVRVSPDGAGSRLDVRSVSRVGKSDVGTNARRVRQYLAAVKG